MTVAIAEEELQAPKAFPSTRGRFQIAYVLRKHGPQTIWELVDILNDKYNVDTNYENVRRSLVRLREKRQVGVVNWKKGLKRRKKISSYYYYARDQKLGEKLGGHEDQEIWALLRNG